MNVNERVVGHGLKHVLDNEPVNTCYLLDQQGIIISTQQINGKNRYPGFQTRR